MESRKGDVCAVDRDICMARGDTVVVVEKSWRTDISRASSSLSFIREICAISAELWKTELTTTKTKATTMPALYLGIFSISKVSTKEN